MSIETALYAHLCADSGVAALVGTRIYPSGQLPQRPTLPAITYQRISTAPIQHRGSSAPTFSRPRFQLSCFAANADGAMALRAAVYSAMGNLAQSSGPRIDVALLQDDRDLRETEPGRYVALLDYFIWHKE